MTAAGHDCVVWQGKINNSGYGLVRYGVLAHRVAYEAAKGPIPKGLVIDHLCRNKLCVNPAHLEAVTIAENTARGVRAPGQKTHCKNGHPFNLENTRFAINNDRVCRQCGRNATNRHYEKRHEEIRARAKAQYHNDVEAARKKALVRYHRAAAIKRRAKAA